MVFTRYTRYLVLLVCCGFFFLGFVSILVSGAHANGYSRNVQRYLSPVVTSTVTPTPTPSPTPSPSPSPSPTPSPTPSPSPSPTATITPTPTPGTGGANLVLVFVLGGLGVVLVVTGIILYVFYSRQG